MTEKKANGQLQRTWCCKPKRQPLPHHPPALIRHALVWKDITPLERFMRTANKICTNLHNKVEQRRNILIVFEKNLMIDDREGSVFNVREALISLQKIHARDRPRVSPSDTSRQHRGEKKGSSPPWRCLEPSVQLTR
jgi:hypothetical protein